MRLYVLYVHRLRRSDRGPLSEQWSIVSVSIPAPDNRTMRKRKVFSASVSIVTAHVLAQKLVCASCFLHSSYQSRNINTMIAHPFAQRHAATASSSSFLSASSSASSSSGKSSYGTAAVDLTPHSIFEDDDRSHTLTPRDRLQTLSSRFSSESLKGNSK